MWNLFRAGMNDGIARMRDLHRRGITPPAMQQYVVERVKTAENFLVIRMFLEPWEITRCTH
jgi:hypothetical protein